MPNKLLFGKQLSAYDDMDIDDLLSKLSPEEIDELNNDLDPDNSLLPPSERCKDQTLKSPTGKFDRDALIKWLEEKAKSEKDWVENAPYQKKTRGKVYQKPEIKNNEKCILAEEGFDWELESEILDAIENASEAEYDELAEYFGLVGFQRNAKYQVLPKGTDEPDNDTNVDEVISKMESNAADLKETNLNNISSISADQQERLFKALKTNSNLEILSCANTKLGNKIAEDFLIDALKSNGTLRELNLSSNFLTSDTIIKIFEALNSQSSKLKKIRLANQAQKILGVRAEQIITGLIMKNHNLEVVSIDLETTDAIHQIARHVATNIDTNRRQNREKKA